MSWMISSLTSSGKYLARNLNWRGVSLAMSWLSTFLFSLSQVINPLVSLYWRPKYQISLRPIVLTTFKLKIHLFIGLFLINLKGCKLGRIIVCLLWCSEWWTRARRPSWSREHLPWKAFCVCGCLSFSLGTTKRLRFAFRNDNNSNNDKRKSKSKHELCEFVGYFD